MGWVEKGRYIFVIKTFSSLLVYVFPNEAYWAIIGDRINRIIPHSLLYVVIATIGNLNTLAWTITAIDILIVSYQFFYVWLI